MVRLVQRQLQIDRLVVEGDVGIACSGHLRDGDLPHAEIRRNAVLIVAAIRQNSLDFIEIGIVQIPQLDGFEGDFEFDGLLAGLDQRGRGRLAVLLLELDGRHRGLLRGGIQCDFRRDGHFVDVRNQMDGVHIDVGAGLEIDGLPDAVDVAVALLAEERVGAR